VQSFISLQFPCAATGKDNTLLSPLFLCIILEDVRQIFLPVFTLSSMTDAVRASKVNRVECSQSSQAIQYKFFEKKKKKKKQKQKKKKKKKKKQPNK